MTDLIILSFIFMNPGAHDTKDIQNEITKGIVSNTFEDLNFLISNAQNMPPSRGDGTHQRLSLAIFDEARRRLKETEGIDVADSGTDQSRAMFSQVSELLGNVELDPRSEQQIKEAIKIALDPKSDERTLPGVTDKDFDDPDYVAYKAEELLDKQGPNYAISHSRIVQVAREILAEKNKNL